MEAKASAVTGGGIMTLRSLVRGGWPRAVPKDPEFHWPWNVLAREVWQWDLDERGKCLHCEDIEDDLPAKKTLGDLVWDQRERQWRCGTLGCDGSFLDWWPEKKLAGPVNGPKPEGAAPPRGLDRPESLD